MEGSPGFEPESTTDVVATWQQVMRDPRAFFATMPETGGLVEPIRFLALCAGIDALGTFLVTWSVVQSVTAFATLVLGSVVLAAVLTLVSQQLCDGRAGFEPVLRAIAFGSAPAVFFWVPRVAVIPCVYAWYLQARGIERVQAFDPARAAVVTGLAWAAVALLARGLAGHSLGWLGTG